MSAEPEMSDESNELISAIREGNLNKVRDLISNHPIRELEANEGFSLLCEAIKCKQSKIAKLLINEGVNVNHSQKSPKPLMSTPLHFAVLNFDTEIVRMLLDRKADVNARNENELSALHIAVDNGRADIVEILLRHDADVNLKNNIDETPSGTRKGIDEICSLLSKRTDLQGRDNRGLTPLHMAIENEHRDIIEILLERGADANLKSNIGVTPLYSAARGGLDDICKKLITKGADVNACYKSVLGAMYVAIENGHTNVVNVLLDHGAYVNLKTNSGETPLHMVARQGTGEICKLLIENGAEVNAQDGYGHTPLHKAIEKGHTNVIKILLEHGADVHIENKEGITPLRLIDYTPVEQIRTLVLLHTKENPDTVATSGTRHLCHGDTV